MGDGDGRLLLKYTGTGRAWPFMSWDGEGFRRSRGTGSTLRMMMRLLSFVEAAVLLRMTHQMHARQYYRRHAPPCLCVRVPRYQFQ